MVFSTGFKLHFTLHDFLNYLWSEKLIFVLRTKEQLPSFLCKWPAAHFKEKNRMASSVICVEDHRQTFVCPFQRDEQRHERSGRRWEPMRSKITKLRKRHDCFIRLHEFFFASLDSGIANATCHYDVYLKLNWIIWSLFLWAKPSAQPNAQIHEMFT